MSPPFGSWLLTNSDAAAAAISTGSAAQAGESTLELGALDVVVAQLDRPLVRARGARRVVGAPKQLGVRGVQRLVACQPRVVEQRLEQRQAGAGPGGERDGDRAIHVDDGRRADLRERRVELGDLWPVGLLLGMKRGDRGLELVRAGAAHPHRPLERRTPLADAS